jgi:hypothetical protein
MDTGVENPNSTIGSGDDPVMDEVIVTALRLIADVYGDHNRPLIDIQPVATGYRAFVENDEGAVTIWVDRVNGEKGTLYVADVTGTYGIRHTVVADDPAVSITRAVFAARPNVNALQPRHGWVAVQTPVFVAWVDKTPQYIGVGVTLGTAARHARVGFDDTVKFARIPALSEFVDIVGGYGYEMARAVENVTRYGASAMYIDREVAARLEKAAAATQ